MATSWMAMATIPTKPELETRSSEARPSLSAASVPSWPLGSGSPSAVSSGHSGPGQSGKSHSGSGYSSQHDDAPHKPSQLDALQALLAFSALHEQVRRRKALAARQSGFDAGSRAAGFEAELKAEFEADEQFVLDEVLQLVAERAVAITGADGLAIALAENDEIVLRASAGMVRPDVGARIDRDSAFSGASFRTAQVVNCDDTETDARVNLLACRRLGARSMVAVPLCGRRRVIGLLEAFSTWPFGFNDSDVRNLTLLAELIVSALRPEDEDRFADSAQVAMTKLEEPARPAATTSPLTPVPIVPTKVVQSSIQQPATQKSVTPQPVIQQAAVQPAAPQSASQQSSAAAVEPKPTEAPLTPSTKPVTPAQAPAKIIKPEALTAERSDAAGHAAKPSVAEPLVSESPVEERSPEPELNLLREPASDRKRLFPILLICTVLGVAFAGGVWWKWKTAQLGSMIVHNEPVAPKTDANAPGSASPSTSPNSSATTGNTATGAAPATATNQNPDALSDAEPIGPPATPQEMAKFPRVTGIRHWSSADSSTVVLDLEDQVQYEAHRLANPDRIYFDLHDTQLAPELTGKSIDIGDTLLNRVRVAQPVAGMTRVVLETKGSSNFSVSLEPNPYRLVVEVRKIGANPKGAVNLFPNAEAEKARLAIVVPPPTKEDLLLRARVPKMRIVVDAGHGGWDLGTVGRRGLLEKDLVLEIAERLGKLLESRLGAEVIYTRQDDTYIPLDERAEMANQAQADLFISVHANYSDLPSARGVETYYTNMFTAPGSKEAGSRDFDPHAISDKPATPTLSSADLHERIEQSRRLAASVQRALYGSLAVQNPGLRDRGIREAAFVVLTESAMPGILAEVSFVSSPTDEQKLRSDGYREQIAEALYKGIARYAASSKGVKVAAK
jgi:N-acetylmuramoyl-L-alanine amidase/putative methionine-R-sulfoxide reductase with GAF domain